MVNRSVSAGKNNNKNMAKAVIQGVKDVWVYFR